MSNGREVQYWVPPEGPREAGPTLFVRLLGPWEAQVQGQPLRPLRTRKGQWLLALLLLQNGHPVERDWLAGCLWPYSATSEALYNLRRSLTDLRSALGPEVHRLETPTPRTLAFDRAGAVVDLFRFDEAIARGDRASLEIAVHLYRGPLLVEWHEEWITPERTAREQSYLGALETLAKEADLDAAAHYLRRCLAVDPLRESAQQALMEALAARGDEAAALLVYREYRLLLHREANTTPGSEITTLFEQLRARTRVRPHSRRPPDPRPAASAGGPSCEREERGGDEARPAPPSNLPHPVSSFVGREKEVREIAARLTVGRLVTLTGPGGVGKTRLAIEIGERLVLDYPEGVWFVELAAVAAPHALAVAGPGDPVGAPTLLAPTVAGVLGVDEQPGRSLTQTLQEFLRTRRLLLILDNCEHLLDESARLVVSLLESCPALRLLATSRQSLGIAGECDWRVPPLSVPVQGVGGWALGGGSGQTIPTPSPLLDYEAVRLFVERGRAAERLFVLTGQTAPAVVAICRHLDGLPLAIELAAARLKAVTVEQIAERLGDRLRLLTSGSRAALPRQQTLRATIDWSYDLLSEAERSLFRRLSLFAGSFTLEAVEAVCGGVGGQASEVGCSVEFRQSAQGQIPNGQPSTPGPQPADVLDLLAQLVDKSLVMVETAAGLGVGRSVSGPSGPNSERTIPNTEPRYRLLETVREYAREKLREGGEETLAQRRHEEFYLRLAEEAAPHWKSPDLAARLDRLEKELDNLRAALDSSLGRDPQRALRLAAALAGFWEERRHLAEGRQRLAAALDRAGTGRRSPAGAAALEGASALALLQEDRRSARALLEESLAIRGEQGDRAGLATALAHLARLTFVRDDYPAARVYYEEALALWKEAEDPAGIAAVLAGLGDVARRQGEYTVARSLHEESLASRRALGDQYGIAQSLIGLGDAALGQGDAAAARAHYEEALALQRELGDRTGAAHALGELANVRRQQGDYAGARRLREESLDLWRALGYKISVIHSLGALGHLAREQGEYEEARRSYAESLRLRQDLGDPYTIAQSLEDFAELAGCERQWARATRLVGSARALRDAIDKPLRPREQAEYDRLLAGARGALGEAAIATAWEEGRAMIGPPLWVGQWEQAITYALER